jgi:hypothetical protein
MNEPTTGADRPNEHRQAEEAILAAIENGVPLSLACCRAAVSYEFFLQLKDWQQGSDTVGQEKVMDVKKRSPFLTR